MVIKTKSPEKILRSLSKELINVRTYIVGLCPCAYAETPAKAYEARRNKRLAEIKKPPSPPEADMVGGVVLFGPARRSPLQ
jgi:hypothetical protein